jgi:hypothetical protein
MTKEDIMVCKMIGKIGEKWVVSLQLPPHEMRLATFASDFILSYKTAGVCGSTRRRSVSGRLLQYSYLIGIPDLHKGDHFPIDCENVAEGIYYALIGSDIGCGIALTHMGISLVI